MTIPAHLLNFWNVFESSNGRVDQARFYESSYFGDSEEMAQDLGQLVLRGVKRATAGSLRWYETTGKRLPAPNDISIVTYWYGKPLCVTETQAVQIVQFNEVTAQFAETEGEGDGSLQYWQEAHRNYFTRECVNAKRTFTENMLIVCESFKMIYEPSASAA